MSVFVLATEKKRHDALFANLRNDIKGDWIRIREKEDMNYKNLQAINPEWIFLPHWSYIIKEDIFNNFNCVVFHMTDLPYGRGGTPLQNLIIRGFQTTKISAIKVAEGIDTGDVYMKKKLSLEGTAEKIFMRSTKIVEQMIKEIIITKPDPVPQSGEIVHFKRRKPDDGNIANLQTLSEVFDYIRMLDCEGYPSAFMEIGKFRLEFSKASLKLDNSIISDVRITKK